MRKGKVKPRIIKPDPKYNDLKLHKFINLLMKDGKKSIAFKKVYGSIDLISQKTEKNGYEYLMEALEKLGPMVELVRRRVRGTNIGVPVPTRPERKFYLACKWCILGARKRSEKSMEERLAMEVMAIHQGEGNAIKKRNEMHKMAEANKAFAHFK